MATQYRLPILAGIVAVAMLAVLLMLPRISAANGEPQPGTVNGLRTYTLVQPTPIAAAGTTYSTVPQVNAAGDDYTRVNNWHSVDLFVSAVVTADMVTTVQFSPDGTNWADAYYVQPSFNSTGTLVENIRAYSVTVGSPSGVGYARVPIAGEYMRVKMVGTGPITPTVWGTFRND